MMSPYKPPPRIALPLSAQWYQQSRKGSFILRPGFYVRMTTFALTWVRPRPVALGNSEASFQDSS